MTRRIRVAAAAGLLFGFYVLVAGGILLWLLLLGAALWLTVFTDGPFPAQVFVACAGTAPLAVALGDAARRTVFHTTDAPEEEVLTGARQAPRLCALVREVAAELDTRPPAIIRFTTDANASVIETDTRFLGVGEGNRCLVIGLPLLAVLTGDQLRAVLAHELAHFSLSHSRARAFTLRLDTSLRLAEDSLERMGEANGLIQQYRGLPRLFVAGYRRFARMLTGATRRRQEEEADREAVRLYGVEALADALRARADAQLAWPAFRDAFLDRRRGPTGLRPDDPFRVFADMAASPEMKPRFERLRTQVVSDPQRSACGVPHADFATRIRTARTSAGPRAARTSATDACAGDLLPDTWYENDLVHLLPEFVGARLVPWRDWTALLAERRAVRLIGPLMRAVDDVAGGGPDALSLRRVIAVLDSGERMPLARALGSHLQRGLRRDDDPLGMLAAAVTALVSALLVSACGASWRIDWAGGAVAVPVDGTPPEEVAEWVEEGVMRPDRTASLTFRLADLGLDDRTPACRLSSRRATDGGAVCDFVLAEVGTELPEETRRLVHVLRSAALSVIVGSVLLGLGVSWGQGREWLRHDTTRSGTSVPGGGAGSVPGPASGSGPATSGPFPGGPPTPVIPVEPVMPVPGIDGPPPSHFSTPFDAGPFTLPR